MSTPLDVVSLRKAVAAGACFRYRFFWGHRPAADGRLSDSVFSQWWRCRFELDGLRYSSAEQAMMAQKARLFGDEEILEQILGTDDPGRCKSLGRKVRGFDEARWAEMRFGIVTRTNIAKFSQSPAIKAYLLGTGEEILAEASPQDRVWGIGMVAQDPRASDPAAWEGENLLGFALMAARDTLRLTVR